MTVENTVKVTGELTGLGEGDRFVESMSTTTVCTKMYHGVQIQATADTAEALNMGNVTTPVLVFIKCITNDVDVDTSFLTSFHAELTVNESEFAVFYPAGIVYLKNNDAAEKFTVESFVWGI